MKRTSLFFLLLFATITASAQSAAGKEVQLPEDWSYVKADDGTVTLQYAGNKRVKNVKVSYPGKVYTVNGVSFNMIDVDGGTFKMGAQKTNSSGDNYDTDAYNDESPVHEVTLSSFSIGETEVTQALWTAVMGSNPSNNGGEGHENYPVEQVSWNDVQTFITKLNELTGETFRLPTEAEWEYAARGGRKSKDYKYSGSNTIDDVAWYTSNSTGSTHTVGTKAPNELGLYDMSGNVYEWCQDSWDGTNNYSTTPCDGSANTSGSYRVLRGGCWRSIAWRCRVSHRNWGDADFRHGDLGFRLALSKSTFTVNGVSFNMKYVEGGTFKMGAQSSDADGDNYDTDAYDDESPVHEVTLGSFSIGETEVTQALWKAVMGADNNPSKFKNDSYPVEQVSWNDVQTFITKLNELTGETFRLSTEAEWEYAARGGRKSKDYKYSGSNTIDDVAWYEGNSPSSTHTVGTKAPNELGLYDMSGNVYEWCQDSWDGTCNYSTTPRDGSANTSGNYRVHRGGSWWGSARRCRVSRRRGDFPGYRADFLGFRLAY